MHELIINTDTSLNVESRVGTCLPQLKWDKISRHILNLCEESVKRELIFYLRVKHY